MYTQRAPSINELCDKLSNLSSATAILSVFGVLIVLVCYFEQDRARRENWKSRKR